MVDVLLGDSDPALIPHLVAGLHDATGYVRAMSASAFFVHGGANRTASRAAVPRLLELLEDADAGVRPVAAGALRAIADRELGEDPAAWRDWWAGQQR